MEKDKDYYEHIKPFDIVIDHIKHIQHIRFEPTEEYKKFKEETDKVITVLRAFQKYIKKAYLLHISKKVFIEEKYIKEIKQIALKYGLSRKEK